MTKVDLSEVERSAVFDPDRQFRYRLGRRWEPGPVVAWVMLNPSIANSDHDDATIRRLYEFTKTLLPIAGGFELVNLFAFVTPYPLELVWRVTQDPSLDIIGPVNDEHTKAAFREADIVCFGWGAGVSAARHSVLGFEQRVDRVKDLARAIFHHPVCLGFTKSGQPRHPLYLAKDTPVQEFRVPS